MKPWNFILLATVLLAGCRSAKPPEVLGRVPPFRLTAQTGREFDSSALQGKVWVADFIFTNCPGPCPRMSSQMGLVQRGASDLPDVRLVSFTVDPERDTPEVLAAYAVRYHAEPGRWFFLTGPRESLHALSRDAFKLGSVDGGLEHSTRFTLVDRQSRIRGYYLTSEPDAIDRLLTDLRTVYKETAQ